MLTPPPASSVPPLSLRIMLHSSLLSKVRILHRILAVYHLALLIAALCLASLALQMCCRELSSASFIVAVASGIRLLWMLGIAVAQVAVASAIIARESNLPLQSVNISVQQSRNELRIWYARWLWLGRFGFIVTLLQLSAASYLTLSFVNVNSNSTNNCYPADRHSSRWHKNVFFVLTLGSWMFIVMQCCTGSDIFAWSSLYARHSQAWRAYYHEMFDYWIREVLCCLGRIQYIKQDDDEVNSVAAVLGDLLTYGAAGASHLEFMAGLSLLQLQPSLKPNTDFTAAPLSLVEEATILHAYAVAAYTGPLLDFGRNPLLFPFVWIYRQGLLAPWKRHRQPNLKGDNWWRGHAAAFLRFSKLTPGSLRNGRVCQEKRECAYFVAVVHHLRCVVVAVRGTESPEDLLTDGLGKESFLMGSDVTFLKTEACSQKDSNHSTMPRFAHEGILAAARELALQLDNFSEIDETSNSVNVQDTNVGSEVGILTSLLGPGGECEGYALRLVGHSLGGSVAALTALKLYSRYPQLRVYGYGVLPCLDAFTADACSSFVISIVYNDEFSSRLSVSSVKRLRVAAVKALAVKSSDVGTVKEVPRQFDVDRDGMTIINGLENDNIGKDVMVSWNSIKCRTRRFNFRLKGGIYLCSHACRCIVFMPIYGSAKAPKAQINSLNQCSQSSKGDPVGVLPCRDRDDTLDEFQEFVTDEADDNKNVPKSFEDGGCNLDCHQAGDRIEAGSPKSLKDEQEMFLPGLVVHIVPMKPTMKRRLWWRWRKNWDYQALIKDRKNFQDIVVSRSMFLDHMPWRCQHALNSTLKQMKAAENEEMITSGCAMV